MAEEVKKILENSVAKAMEGMNITFPMAYHDRSWYGTWLRPKDALDSLSNSQIPPPVTLEQKRHWPVGTEDSEIPRKELLRQHHKVPDPHYTVPPSKKELLPPQPVYPQSRGIKLRDVDTIVKESKYLRPDTAQSRKPQQQQTSNFKKPEASSRQQPSSSTDNNSTVASILHDIYSASQPQPKPSTSSSNNSTSLRLPKNDQRNRPTPTKSTSSSSSSNAKKNAPSPAIKKSTSKLRSNVSSNNNSLSEPENNYRTHNNDPHPYTVSPFFILLCW